MFKRIAIFALALSAIALVSCSSAGDDAREAVNPLSENEQIAQAAVTEINDSVRELINSAGEVAPAPTSVRTVAETEDNFDQTFPGESNVGSVRITGTYSFNEDTETVTFSGTYEFANYQFASPDPENEHNVTVYVIDGTETINFTAKSTSSRTSTKIISKTTVSEGNDGDLTVSVDSASPIALVFTSTNDYTVTSSTVVPSDYASWEDFSFTSHITVKGALEGTYNGQEVYQPYEFERDIEVDFSDMIDFGDIDMGDFE